MTLREFIDEHGLKLRRVAVACRISERRFYRLAGGIRVPTITEAVQITAALREMTGREIALDEFWPVTDPVMQVRSDD